MTVLWCIRRAELVLKSSKGFVIEAVSWRRDESSMLQFMLPHNISEELHNAFFNFPNIFIVFNSKILVENLYYILFFVLCLLYFIL